MKHGSILPFLSILCIAFIAGCSGKGPDLVDPASGNGTQVAFLAVGEGAGGDLLRYDEATHTAIENAYSNANGGPLGAQIDGIYESFALDTLFLHSRATGTITAIDVKTRKKVGEITGFPASSDSGLIGMAFSNLAEAWVIAHNSPNIYYIDSYNLKFVRTIPLEGLPTSIWTYRNKIFVGMRMGDGTGRVDTFSSNLGFHTPMKAYELPTPVIYAGTVPDSSSIYLITSGNESRKPGLYPISTSRYELGQETVFNEVSSLASYIGQQPNFASFSNDFYLYVATPEGVIRVDSKNHNEMINWLTGSYRIIGVDYWTDLLYLYSGSGNMIQRLEKNQVDPTDIAVPGPVRAIEFISPSKVQ